MQQVIRKREVGIGIGKDRGSPREWITIGWYHDLQVG
jgi:hypothetical protein